MIRLRVKRIAEQEGLNISQLTDRSGLAYSVVSDYWHNRMRRVDLVTLERLCKALGTTPEAVIEYLPDVDYPEDTRNPDESEAVVSASLIGVYSLTPSRS